MLSLSFFASCFIAIHVLSSATEEKEVSRSQDDEGTSNLAEETDKEDVHVLSNMSKMVDAPEVPGSGARALFESCVNSRQCRRSNPLLRCVDSVCLCPRPHVLTPDARCSAPPRGGSEAPGLLTVLFAAAPTAALVLTLLALGALYGCHRWKQRSQQSSSSSTLTGAADTPGDQQSPPQQPLVHPESRVNQRFLRSFMACHEYNRARRLGLPLPAEGERRPLATTMCLFREYTTVSSATTLAPDAAGERSERGAAAQRLWTSAGRSDGDAGSPTRSRPPWSYEATADDHPG